ncbi:MAG: hypothetical protein COA42_11695 [Alteromonadaceae bacterium]|nr:MAG: hypothetical protein COA42_11695 [Alteromonadaceae bacterium]
MKDNPSEFKNPENPVEKISWKDCQTFIEKLKQLPGAKYINLPTEAQWEYACRAGTTEPLNFGSEISLDLVNYSGKWKGFGGFSEGAQKATVAAKSYKPNAWGLYQMHGNVWEWCSDWFAAMPSQDAINPTGPDKNKLTENDMFQNEPCRVLRGGS